MTYKLYFTSCQKDYIVDFVNILGYLTSLIVVYFLIKVGNTIQIVKLFGSIIFIIKPFILKYIFEKKSGVIIDNKSNYIFKEKLNGLAHHIAATVQGSTDIIVLTFLSTLTNISIYSVYALVINGIRSIVTALVNGLDGYLGMKIANKDKDLNKKFFSYIFYYYSIITTLLSCTIILIIPFIKMYTIEITDANYINSIFANIMVYAEFLYTIRYPYSSLVYSKGHFKETTKYAIIEPIVNIALSVFLVKKIGLVGIAIGTVCSMPIRSFGFMYHAVNNILNEKMYKHIKIITISFLEFSVLFVLKDHLLLFDKFNYCAFFLQGLFLIFVCGTIIFIINYLLFKNEMQVKSKKK